MTGTTQEKLGAYTSVQQVNQDSRETDKRALLNCASHLKDVLDAGGKDMNEYANAIRHNQELWTMFQVAMCDPGNPLPRDLKQILLNLSRYVDRTSFRAVTEFMPDSLKSLIDINRAIAAGLAKAPPVQAQAPAITAAVTQQPSMPPASYVPVQTTA